MTYTLADLPMFGELGEERLRGLAALARRRRYPAGQMLCTEGDPADQLIVLLDGYLPRTAVLELVATEPAVAARLLRTLAATVRDLDERLTDATVRDVPARVATWLVRRCADGRVPLHAGQAGLGAEIGATRVSVNRALRAFERRGMIEIGGGEVIVLDRQALARRAAL